LDNSKAKTQCKMVLFRIVSNSCGNIQCYQVRQGLV